MTIEEAIKYFEDRVDDPYYVEVKRDAFRLALEALKFRAANPICKNCSHYLPYKYGGRLLTEGKCTKYQITVSDTDLCKAKRWESLLPQKSTEE